ncbi:hypothetical protein [Pseudoroseomonas cervicalis]|uniref:hypothetical protein n=1 Tax=Teichococcus cervicalis TaxID=204525 RepID=UPI0022F1C8B4|nr:hypothetical protein [Pseudoroseomonas cervicalis]WBV45430.1 hypothetical protein PFY06_20595 [Pseudoroseomonas cervicalis]
MTTDTLRAARPAAPALPRRAGGGGPAGEGALARALRWIADRGHLAELEPRLLRDVGLTPEAVRRGEPFRLHDRPQRL